MSRRQPMNPIKGPRSALTDYLASQNISASQIRRDHQDRLAAARATAHAEADPDATTETAPVDDVAATEVGVAQRARKRKIEEETIKKIKKSKAFKRRLQYRVSSYDDDQLDAAAEEMFREGDFTPVPGQIENCEMCQKRFTVTPYTRAGPNGGLLCPKCSKKIADEEKATKQEAKKKTTTGPAGRSRRKVQSQILDGMVGVKSLVTLCVETLASNITLADSLGDLPPQSIDRIARHLSKRRLVNSETLELFLQPQADKIALYDAASLGQQDYIRIFQTCSNLEQLKLCNAIQFRDDVMEYLTGRNFTLDSIYLSGANLLTGEFWEKYLKVKGKGLKNLCVYFTDKHFTDKTVKSLKDHCPSLGRLKICHNQEVSNDGLIHIANLRGLQHLGLQLVKTTSTEPYIYIINKVGKNLRTFSLRMVPGLDDRLLDAIHENCARLVKLRITHSEVMTDAGFVRLFEGWKNKPLSFIDLEQCRHVDSEHPRENPHKIGFCSDGFRSMMKHSGKYLKKLNLHGCRNISQEAFEEVFSPEKVYPALADLEISFCEEVTSFIVQSIFRSCPGLKRLNVFGCMKVNEVKVPKGKIVVGAPNALGMVLEGTED